MPTAGLSGVCARISAAFRSAMSDISSELESLRKQVSEFNSFDDARRVAEVHEGVGRPEFLEPLATAAAGRDARHFSAMTATSAIFRSPAITMCAIAETSAHQPSG